VEVHTDPFAPPNEADTLMLPPEDERRPAVRVANPLGEDQPNLRTTLLPGLFRTLLRNIGRGFPDTALFETGLVFRPRPGAPETAPILATDRGPTVSELATLEAALPDQPLWIGGVLAGNRELPGWWGPGRTAGWADAIEAARQVAAVAHLTFDVRAAQQPPWHPGRCAALYVRAVTGDSGASGGSDDSGGSGGSGASGGSGGSGGEHRWLAGYAGELHPRVVAAYGLPPRTCAFELDFAVLATAAEAAGPVPAPVLSAYPLATQDVALIVPESVPAADVAAALATPAPSSARTVSRSPARCASALPTGRSPWRRRRRPGTPPWPRPHAGSGPYLAPYIRNVPWFLPGAPRSPRGGRAECVVSRSCRFSFLFRSCSRRSGPASGPHAVLPSPEVYRAALPPAGASPR
jgi:phenylalanyl-tRNA synthetase beta chain